MGNTITACSADSSGVLTPQNPQPGNGPAPPGTIPCAAGADGLWYPLNISSPESPPPNASATSTTAPAPGKTSTTAPAASTSTSATSAPAPASKKGLSAHENKMRGFGGEPHGQATAPGALPSSPKSAASLPPDSPAAANPTTTTTGALINAIPALPTGQLTLQSFLYMAFFAAWVIFGIMGFVMSLICLGYTGNVGEKILGIIIAIALGPFFFLYYFSDAGYCKRFPPTLF
jgi:hypothetical protein